MIFAKYVPMFNLPEGIEMNDKDICVTGLIKTYQGKAEMILNDVGQLTIKTPIK